MYLSLDLPLRQHSPAYASAQCVCIEVHYEYCIQVQYVGYSESI